MLHELVSGKAVMGAMTWLDILILAGAIALMLVIAFLAGRKEKSTSDFFLGGRQVPILVAALSFVATEVSAVTITNVPGTGFTENLQYLQFFIGSAASKIFVAFLFIPVFFKHNCTSIYEFLRARFGPPTQYSGSIFFFLTRLLASGARLYAACFAISWIMGWTLLQALLLFTVASIVYIAFGGIKAVVWTGAYQATVFYAAGLAVIIFIFTQIDGGMSAVWQHAGEAGRLSVFNWGWEHVPPGQSVWKNILNNPTTFWAGTANAFFIGLAVFGTDQELVQRLLTVKTRRSSQGAILTTIVAAFPITLIYLVIGTLMFVYFKQHPGLAAPALAKEVFPDFITRFLPMGLKGLVLAAIILASIDSPLSSLSSSFVMDIYRPLINSRASQRHYLWVSRLGVAGFGLILGGIALLCTGVSNVLWLAFQIISVTGGSMLGIFLLGILTRRGTNRGNIIAMTVNSAAMIVLMFLSNYGPVGLAKFFHLTGQAVPKGESVFVPIAWSWAIVIGTILTFTLAYMLSFVTAGGSRAGDPTTMDPVGACK